MSRDRAYFLLLNIGHFLDHLFMLIFATAAALALGREWGVGYAELIAYATPGFVAFGVFAVPAGWLADRWSRDGMMVVFFLGVGAAAMLTSLAGSPLEIGAGLFLIGVFAAIYHPVGLAIVTMKWRDTGMRIAVNGVWGNLGVASAALVTGFLIDQVGWRMAFILPGIFSIAVGLVYLALRWRGVSEDRAARRAAGAQKSAPAMDDAFRRLLMRVSALVFLTTAITSIIFQSTTFALPKIFEERLHDLAAGVAAWLDGSAASPGSRRARTSALPQRVERRNGDLVVLRVDPRRHVLRVRGLSAAVFCRCCNCHGARGGSSGAPARADRLAHRLVPEHGRGDRNPAAARSVGAQRVGFKMKTAPATDGAPMRPGCGPSGAENRSRGNSEVVPGVAPSLMQEGFRTQRKCVDERGKHHCGEVGSAVRCGVT